MAHRDAAAGHIRQGPSRVVVAVVTFGDRVLRRVRNPRLLFRRTPRPIRSIKGMTEAQFAAYARASGMEAELARVLADGGERRAQIETEPGIQGGEKEP